MSLTEVVVSSEVWLTCATHALSTEAEEIMGLLLGDIDYDYSGRTPVVSAKIWGAAPQVRADRRKDRVETTPEQLAAASAEADRMSAATGMRTRVIGWYHSHPHITVHPSHVDVRTQGMYQMLDEGFVGLIFSAFNRASSHAQAGQLQAVAFQSVSARDKEQREQKSRHTPARGQWAQLGTKREHSSHPSVSDLEPQELAVVLAAVDDDVPSSDFTAWEVPIKVVSSARAFPSLPRAHAVAPLTGLQRMLLLEEKEAYEKAVEEAHRHGDPNPLELIHHHATYQAALCRLMETCLVPAIAALEDITRSNKAALSALHVSSPHSPIASSPPPMSSSQPAPVTPGVTPGVRSGTEAAALPVVSRSVGPSTRDTRTRAGGPAKRHSGNSSHSRETGQAMGQVQASRRDAPARGDRAGQRIPALSAGMGTGTDGGMVTGTATGVSTAAHLKAVLATVLGEFRDVDTTEAVSQIAELCQLLSVTDPHCLPSAVTHLSTRAWHCEQLLRRMQQTQASLQTRQEQVTALAECIESWKAQLLSDDDISRATDDVADKIRRTSQEQQQLSLQRSAAQGSLEAAGYSADVDMAALLQLAAEVQGEEEEVGRLQHDLAIYSDLPTDITLARTHLQSERERLRALSRKLEAWSMGEEVEEGEDREGYGHQSPGEGGGMGTWGVGGQGEGRTGFGFLSDSMRMQGGEREGGDVEDGGAIGGWGGGSWARPTCPGRPDGEGRGGKGDELDAVECGEWLQWGELGLTASRWDVGEVQLREGWTREDWDTREGEWEEKQEEGEEVEEAGEEEVEEWGNDELKEESKEETELAEASNGAEDGWGVAALLIPSPELALKGDGEKAAAAAPPVPPAPPEGVFFGDWAAEKDPLRAETTAGTVAGAGESDGRGKHISMVRRRVWPGRDVTVTGACTAPVPVADVTVVGDSADLLVGVLCPASWHCHVAHFHRSVDCSAAHNSCCCRATSACPVRRQLRSCATGAPHTVAGKGGGGRSGAHPVSGGNRCGGGEVSAAGSRARPLLRRL
ncbi:unnamed protein product [Closterium sp. Naga37s-1]|nr:unnamed protein product [Closterium sp. Naga37s-1]